MTCKHKCKRDPDSVWCPGCKEDQSLDGMKDYFFFKTGTWWVYQEQNSGELDTVTVFYDYDGNTNGYDEFEWKSSSSHFQYNFYYEFSDSYSIHCLTDEDCTCRKLRRDKSRPGDYVGGGQYFTYPIIEGNSTNDDGVCKVLNIAETDQINNNVFNAVAEFDIEVDESANHIGHHTKYRWAKNAGIVDFQDLNSNTHWNLIEYHIEQ